MFKEKGGLRTRCPVVIGCEAKQAHKTHLLGWLVKLETRIWQCFLEASQASLWAALQYFQTEWKLTGIQSPKQSTQQQRLVLASSSLAKKRHEVSEKSRELGQSKHRSEQHRAAPPLCTSEKHSAGSISFVVKASVSRCWPDPTTVFCHAVWWFQGWYCV